MKTKRIMIRVSPDDHRRYAHAVEASGLTLSQAIRDALERRARKVEKAAIAATSNGGKIR